MEEFTISCTNTNTNSSWEQGCEYQNIVEAR